MAGGLSEKQGWIGLGNTRQGVPDGEAESGFVTTARRGEAQGPGYFNPDGNLSPPPPVGHHPIPTAATCPPSVRPPPHRSIHPLESIVVVRRNVGYKQLSVDVFLPGLVAGRDQVAYRCVDASVQSSSPVI